MKATFKVTNTGNVDGAAVPMLFLDYPTIIALKDIPYPSKLLKGFEKIFIRKGETKDVVITIDEHGLSRYWQETFNNEGGLPFYFFTGAYTINIGFHATDTEMKSAIVTASSLF